MRMRIVAALAVNMTVISHGPTIGQEGDFVARLNAGLDEQIIAMKKQMPIELDQVTKLTDMTRNGFSITYWYKVALPEAKWTQKMREDMFKVYLKQNCLTMRGQDCSSITGILCVMSSSTSRERLSAVL